MDQEAAFLKAIVEGRDDSARLAFADWLEERGDERARWVRDPDIFKWMGPRAESPLPSLVAAIREEDFSRQWEAAELLPRCAGPGAVWALLAILESGKTEGYDSRARAAAAALSQMGGAVEPIVPRLVELIRQRPDASSAPALALSAVPEAAARAAADLVPELIERLGRDREADWYEGFDIETVDALGAFGTSALAAVPAIVDRLSRDLNGDAGDALAAIGPQATTAILHEAAHLDDDFMVRALRPLRSYGEAAAQQLRDALRHESAGVRALAAMALAPLDPNATLPHLLAARDYGHRGDYFSALGEALEQARPAAANFVPQLRAAAGDAPYGVASLLDEMLTELNEPGA